LNVIPDLTAVSNLEIAVAFLLILEVLVATVPWRSLIEVSVVDLKVLNSLASALLSAAVFAALAAVSASAAAFFAP
jgi:hypothetical protein